MYCKPVRKTCLLKLRNCGEQKRDGGERVLCNAVLGDRAGAGGARRGGRATLLVADGTLLDITDRDGVRRSVAGHRDAVLRQRVVDRLRALGRQAAERQRDNTDVENREIRRL